MTAISRPIVLAVCVVLLSGIYATSADRQSGTVLESMDAGNYTYVRVDLGDEEIWAAAPRFQVGVGDTISFPPGAPMENFHSPSMDRTFELIYFVNTAEVEGGVTTTHQPGADQLPAGHPPIGQSNAPPAATTADPVKPDTPSEGHSVEDVITKKSELAGKAVAVRGKIVKANQGILGTNWYHIQDGSGSAAEGTSDLTITSSGVASVGQTVVATGTLTLDKDFGAGYRYSVIVIDADLVIE